MLTCHSQCFPVQLHPNPQAIRVQPQGGTSSKAAEALHFSALGQCLQQGWEGNRPTTKWTNREIQKKLSKLNIQEPQSWIFFVGKYSCVIFLICDQQAQKEVKRALNLTRQTTAHKTSKQA